MNEMLRLVDPSSVRDAHAFLRSRRSVRSYHPEKLPAEALERIFDSAARAPSAHNRQPWRYVVIEDPGVKVRLAKVMGARLAADRRRDGDPEEAIRSDVSRSFERMTGAPILIVVAMTVFEMDTYPDETRSRAEYLMAVQSTAMATQNLLLAAHAEGLGSCWMCAPLFCPAEVHEVLSLPDGWQPLGLLTLGYAALPGRLKPRKPISEFVIFASPDRGREP
jgi:coenzyme F420-0:L-glutamate ligase / coenzyme F420-1:gamma-L-glutamate ligase